LGITPDGGGIAGYLAKASRLSGDTLEGEVEI
jgi:hypothetical protein